MTVTPDAIGVAVAIFVALVTFIGAVGALLSRQSRWINERFDKVDARFDRVDRRMDRVEAELVEVKIAVARLEGPQPRLLRP